jgi:hypothetical protein
MVNAELAMMKGLMPAPRSYSLIVCFAVALLSVVGCSKPKFYPVRGDVVVYGVGPLREGEVRFRPVKRPDLIAIAKVQKDGKFEASTPNHGEGVLEGDCHVSIIVEPKNGKRVIAEKFADFDKADQSFTIHARNENYCQIQVSK